MSSWVPMRPIFDLGVCYRIENLVFLDRIPKKPVQMKQIFIKWHVSDIRIILLWKNITTVIFSNSKRSTPGIIDLEPCEKFWMKVFFAHPKFSEALIIRSFWTEFIRNYFYEYCYNFR